MRWIIFYSDGSRFSSDDGTVFDAPRQDVQVIAQSDPDVGYKIASMSDFFCFDPVAGGWYGTDFLYDYLLRCKNPVVLFGRQLAPKDWQKLHFEITQALGPKSAWLQGEKNRVG